MAKSVWLKFAFLSLKTAQWKKTKPEILKNSRVWVGPVLEFPPEPASRVLRLLGACENAYFAISFKLVGLMAIPSE